MAPIAMAGILTDSMVQCLLWISSERLLVWYRLCAGVAFHAEWLLSLESERVTKVHTSQLPACQGRTGN